MPKQSYTRRPDGRYRIKYKDKYFYGETISEAQAKKKEYERLLANGIKEQEMGVSVGTYAIRWIETHKRGKVSERVYDTHARILNRFIAMYGGMRMRDIVMSDIQAFYNKIPGKSKSSINSTRNTIKALFRSALADRIIIYDPTLDATVPKGTKGTHRAITAEERQLILDTPHERTRAGVIVMLYAGLRRGEAMALNIDRDVDFERKLIYVREAVRFDSSGHPMIVAPKTEAGIRTVPLVEIVERELMGKTGLLMQSSTGGLMSESAFDRAWQSYISALETQLNGCRKRWYGKTKEHKALLEQFPDALPPWRSVSIRPHDLRHSYRTMLYDLGVDTKSAMKWLGHADEDVSVNVYTHLTPERENASILLLNSGINGDLGVKTGVKAE